MSETLKAALDALIAERDELNTVIAGLAKRIGVPVPPSGGGGGGNPNPGGGGGGDPVAGTFEGEYHGFTSTKAAGEVLKKFGNRQHPIKTKALFDAIKKGGVDIANEDGLYRSLARSRNFRKVGRGIWGLSEWYPARTGQRILKNLDGTETIHPDDIDHGPDSAFLISVDDNNEGEVVA
jgi:hypothetical protein